MPFARIASNIRLTAAAVLFGTLTIAARAQEPPAAPTPQNTPETRPLPVLNYSQPVSHFPNPIGPYSATAGGSLQILPIPRALIP